MKSGGRFTAPPEPGLLKRAGNYVHLQDAGFKFTVYLWPQDTRCTFSKAKP